MPGERRGGRTRATPNRRTILADRIMAVLEGCLMASPKERLSKLINDAELLADIRMAVAQKAFPDRAGGVRRARPAKSEIHTVGRTQQREPRATLDLGSLSRVLVFGTEGDTDPQLYRRIVGRDAAEVRRAATATPVPLDDPPGMRFSDQGLRTVPK